MEIPVRFEMLVYITDGEETIGKAHVDLPIGEYPTKEKIDEWILKSVKAAQKQNEKLRLVTPTEFSETIGLEETGQSMRVCGCQAKWDALGE